MYDNDDNGSDPLFRRRLPRTQLEETALLCAVDTGKHLRKHCTQLLSCLEMFSKYLLRTQFTGNAEHSALFFGAGLFLTVVQHRSKSAGNPVWLVLLLCSREIVRQQVVTKLGTNFTTQLTRQDHHPPWCGHQRAKDNIQEIIAPVHPKRWYICSGKLFNVHQFGVS